MQKKTRQPLKSNPGGTPATAVKLRGPRKAVRAPIRHQKVPPRVLSMALYTAFTGGAVNLLLPASLAWANPQGAQVVQGQATFQTQGNQLTSIDCAHAVTA